MGYTQVIWPVVEHGPEVETNVAELIVEVGGITEVIADGENRSLFNGRGFPRKKPLVRAKSLQVDNIRVVTLLTVIDVADVTAVELRVPDGLPGGVAATERCKSTTDRCLLKLSSEENIPYWSCIRHRRLD